MIIGFDGSRAFTAHRTGTENYSYQLLKALAKLDHQNSYLVYLRPGSKTDSGWPNNFRFQTIRYPRLWTQAGLAGQTFKDHLDVLFVPSHTLPVIKKPGLKTVLTIHDLGAEYLPQLHQLKQRLYLNLMTRHQIQSATHLIAVSQATKDDLVKKVGINPKKITVIHEGFNSDLAKPLKRSEIDRVLKDYDIDFKDYFLFVGTIQPRKNLSNLIIAYSNYLKTVDSASGAPKLVLAGGKGWLSEEIYQLPKQLGIEARVKFLGYIPDHDLSALYSGAQAFLFPSLFEGFGLPILEAMSSGTPVLTSNLSSMPEVAGQAAILVDPYSTEDITKGITKIMTPGTGAKLQQAGLQQIKKFSWEKAAQETLEVLEKVANLS